VQVGGGGDLPPVLKKWRVDFGHGLWPESDRAVSDAAARLLRGERVEIEMKNKLLGLGLGLTLSTLGVVAVPATASFADTTCYTGCTTPATGTSTPVTVAPQPMSTPIEPVQAPAAAGLPFTGADIEGMATVGAGALVLGGLMVRRSRRLRRVTA
jgi:hypothetical protein